MGINIVSSKEGSICWTWFVGSANRAARALLFLCVRKADNAVILGGEKGNILAFLLGKRRRYDTSCAALNYDNPCLIKTNNVSFYG